MAGATDRLDAQARIRSLRLDLDAILDAVEEQRKLGADSADYQSYLNDYAVVRMAGYLEQLCFVAISGRVNEVSSGDVQVFISSWFYKSPNLTSTGFTDLFKRFGPSVRGEVSQFMSTGLNSNLLNSLLEIRNNVAHGKESGTGQRRDVATYRQLVDDVQTLVFRLLLDDPAFV